MLFAHQSSLSLLKFPTDQFQKTLLVDNQFGRTPGDYCITIHELAISFLTLKIRGSHPHPKLLFFCPQFPMAEKISKAQLSLLRSSSQEIVRSHLSPHLTISTSLQSPKLIFRFNRLAFWSHRSHDIYILTYTYIYLYIYIFHIYIYIYEIILPGASWLCSRTLRRAPAALLPWHWGSVVHQAVQMLGR